MAASRQEIDLVVNAMTKGFDKMTSEIKGVEKATDNAGDSAKGGGLRFTELASALSIAQQAFQVVAGAAKFAYENISEGAQLNLARDQFDNLAGSINTTSESLLSNLKAATKGMQSDAELIAGATDIINLGLAKTEGETVRLATAVSTLGLDMQQVILTFANNSKARLDALGLSIEDVDAKVAELNAQGFDGDAFDEAVLIGLEEKMRLLGDASVTTAGQLQQLEADWKNLTDSWKQGAAEALGPVISETVRNRTEVEKLRAAYEAGLITNTQYAAAMNNVQIRGESAAEVFAKLGFVVDETGKVIGRITEDGVKLTAQNKDLAASAEEVTEAYVQEDAVLRAVNKALLDFSGDLGPTTQELEDMAYATGEAASSKEQLQAGIDRATAAMEAEKAAAEAAAKAEEDAARAAKEHAASMGDLFRAAIESKDGIGLFNETASQMADRTIYVSNLTGQQRDVLADLQAEYDKAQQTIVDYTMGAKGVGLETEKVNEVVAEQQERMAELQAAMEPLLAVGGEYANVQGTMTINQEALNQAIFDAADSQGASAEQLAILGGALGLYSEEAVQAALQTALIQAKIDELTAQYIAGDISVEGMRASLEGFINTLNEIPDAIVTEVSLAGIDEAIAKAGSLANQLNQLGNQAMGAGVGDATQRTGGAVGLASGTDGWVRVPGPPGAPFPVTLHGGEGLNVSPNGIPTGGGGVTQNNYFANPQNPNAIATATAEKLGQLK